MSHRNPNRPTGGNSNKSDDTNWYENENALGRKDYEQGYTTLKRRVRTHNGPWVDVEEARRREKGGDMDYFMMKGY